MKKGKASKGLDTDAIIERVSLAKHRQESFMVPIGKGNPYLHCRDCGVTNVELSWKPHHEDCAVLAIDQTFVDIENLVLEVLALREEISKLQN